MRTSTIFCFVAGLFAMETMAWANNQPAFDQSKPATGALCCTNHGIADNTFTCKNNTLNSYCCINQRNDYPSDGLGDKGGCDRFTDFPTGRTVESFATGGCASGTSGGFVGCAA
ncbi:hypothetical protein MCOR25_006210 [Pyricularia grisea]|nr:hypothetical protein MCOR25_006210 [Pyricularia grisea]